MKLDIQQVALASSPPMTYELPAGICQIRLPTTHQTCSTSTSWKFLWKLSSGHFNKKVLKLMSDAQCHGSSTRTYKCGRVGLRNGWNGQSITGRLWTSQMSPYSTLLALVGWNGFGGSQESAWTHEKKAKHGNGKVVVWPVWGIRQPQQGAVL